MSIKNKITESQNKRSIDIDKKSVSEILDIFNIEDFDVVNAVKKTLPDIEKIIDLIIDAIDCFLEKKVGSVSSNFPAMKVPPSICGMTPLAE